MVENPGETPRRYLIPLLAAVIFAVSVALYLNIMDGAFIKDDIFVVLRNDWITDFSHIFDAFLSSLNAFVKEGSEDYYYRPVLLIFFMVGYKLSALSTWGYHLVNVLIHASSAVLVFFISLKLFTDFAKRAGWLSKERIIIFAAFAALFFAATPINTEAVIWISAVSEVSFALFFLAAFLSYINGRRLLSAFFFIVSLLSKETAITLPILILCYDLALRRVEGRGLRSYVSDYWPFALGFIIYFALRTNALSTQVSGTEESILANLDPVYLLNVAPLVAEYFKSLIWPVNLIFFQYERFELIGSLFEARAGLWLAATVLFLYLLYRAYRVERELFFTVCWILIPLAPAVFYGWTANDPSFAERYLYLPSVGFGILTAWIGLRVVSSSTREGSRSVKGACIVGFLFLAVFLLYCAGTVKRSVVWKTPITLWSDVKTKAPANVVARLWLGNEYAKSGMFDEAVVEYKDAIRFNPDDDLIDGIHNNLGIVYSKRGQLDDAVREFRLALRIAPENREARKNLDKALGLLKKSGAIKRSVID